MPQKDRELIPHRALEDGFSRAEFQINALIHSSQLSFDGGEYTTSIALSILAYEELYKMHTFARKLIKRVGISEKEWNQIIFGSREERKSAHVVKMEKSYLDKKQDILEKGKIHNLIAKSVLTKLYGYDDYREFEILSKTDPLALARLVSFTKIKNSCFYLGWKDGKWDFFNNISKPERQALAKFLLFLTNFEFKQTLLDKKHPRITNDE